MYSVSAKVGGSLYEIFCNHAIFYLRWIIRVLDMLVYIKRIQAYNVLMAKLQIMCTAWPDIEIFLVSVFIINMLYNGFISLPSPLFMVTLTLLSAASRQKRLKPTLRSLLSSYNDSKLIILLCIVS